MILPALVLILTLAHWLILVARIPVLTELPWWFWDFSEQPLDAAWLLAPLAGIAALAVWLARRAAWSPWLRIAALVVLGFAWQQGLGLLEGRGLDGVRDHIVWTGHAQFARAAVRQESVGDVIRDYERQTTEGAHGKYARSKPPGTLLLYVFSDRVAGWLRPGGGDFERLEWLQTFASYSWPFVCYWVLLPMAALARRTLHPEAGPLAGAFYLLVPSVSLMTLHTDQTFYPLLAVTSVLLAALAGQRGSPALALAAGAWLYAAVFCSFGLVVIAPLAGAVALSLARDAAGGFDRARLAKLAAGAAAGWLASDALLRLAFGYDIAVRYRSALAHHLAWKFGWEWSVSNVGSIAWLDFLDFTLWLGVPLAVAAGAAGVAGWRRLRAERLAPGPTLAAALLAVFAGLLFLSRTKGEAGRLWLFLVPFACLLAGDLFARLPAGRRRWLLPGFAVLQAGSVLLTKAFQDF